MTDSGEPTVPGASAGHAGPGRDVDIDPVVVIEPDATPGHHAFISYQKSSSLREARMLQDALEAVARRSKVTPKLDVFRDETRLAIADLGQTLERELATSRRLVVLLHADTNSSPWVDREIQHWLTTGGSPDRLILVRIDPGLDLTWDNATRGFTREDALPESLRGIFTNEPLWVDLCQRRRGKFDDPSSQIARLCATLLERDPADLLQRELRAQRRRQVLLSGGLLALSVLLVVAVIASVVAVRAQGVAQERESEATAQAESAEALLIGSSRPERSMELLVDATHRSQSQSVRTAVYAVLEQHGRLDSVLMAPDVFDGESPDDLVYSSSGSRLAAWRTVRTRTPATGTVQGQPDRRIQVAIWDLDQRKVSLTGEVDGWQVSQAEMLGDERLVYCGSEGVEMISLTPGGETTRETLLAGADTCRVYRLRGGLLTVAKKGDERARALLLGAQGQRTTIESVWFAMAGDDADVALIGVANGPAKAVSADGARQIEISGLTSGSTLLWEGESGSAIFRLRDGRVVRTDPLSGNAAVTSTPIANGALAASEIPGMSDEYVWLGSDLRLRWTLGDQSLDLSELRENTPMDRAVTPAIWINQSGSLAVVSFQAAAARVSLTTAATPPTMKREPDASISAYGAKRTELMAPQERGRNGVILPGGNNRYVLVQTTTRVETGEGIAVFDPTRRVAVSFGKGKLRLFPESFGEAETLLDATDTKAIAFSPAGTRLATVRPGGAIAIFTTEPRSTMKSLVEVKQDSPRLSAAFGEAVVRNSGDGRIVLADRNGDNATTFDQYSGSYRGLMAIRPDGTEAVIATGKATGGTNTFVATRITRSDGANELAAPCGSTERTLRYLPGKAFRTDVAAAELQQLTAVFSTPDAEAEGDPDAGQDSCDPSGTPNDRLATSSEVLDYQMNSDEGRILARRQDGTIDVTTWRRGQAGSLRTVDIPGTDERTGAAIDPASARVTTWNGAGRIGVLRPTDGGGYSTSLALQSAVSDPVAAVPLEHLQLVAVVGSSGTVEVFDMASGRTLIRRELGLSSANGSEGTVVRWASAEESDGAYVLRVATGKALGPADRGHRITAPFQIEILRARLCEIHPTAEQC